MNKNGNFMRTQRAVFKKVNSIIDLHIFFSSFLILKCCSSEIPSQQNSSAEYTLNKL